MDRLFWPLSKNFCLLLCNLCSLTIFLHRYKSSKSCCFLDRPFRLIDEQRRCLIEGIIRYNLARSRRRKMVEEKEKGIAFQTVGQFCLWRGENISVYERTEKWTEKVGIRSRQRNFCAGENNLISLDNLMNERVKRWLWAENRVHERKRDTFRQLLRSLFTSWRYFDTSRKRSIKSAFIKGILKGLKLKWAWYRPRTFVRVYERFKRAFFSNYAKIV